MEEKPRVGRPTKPTVDFIARNKAKVKEIARNRSQSKGLEDQENTHKPTKPHFKPKKTNPAKGLSDPPTNPPVSVEPTEQKEETTKTIPEEQEAVVETDKTDTELKAESSVPVESHSETVPTALCPSPPAVRPLSPPPSQPPNSEPLPAKRSPSTGDIMELSNPPPAFADFVVVDSCSKRSRNSAAEASATQLSPKRFKRLSQRDSQS